ncbi:MAG: 50S ribosomal protein L15 [Vampirovibrio sp.]
MTVLTLTDIQPNKGSNRKRLRVGRGLASGAGKTSNRGNNGQGQRSGNSAKRGFEGGQMPLYRRIPKFRTFPQPNPRQWLEINVGDLHNYAIAGQTHITYKSLVEAKKWPTDCDGIRLLGNGEPKVAYTVQCHHATPSAMGKLTAAKGKVELLTTSVREALA